MYHHVRKLMYTVRVGVPDPRFGNMLLEQFGGDAIHGAGQVERLNQAFHMLGEEAEPKTCRAMQGLIEEGQEKVDESEENEELSSGLALITAAQKVEHYEIAGYGNARTLAMQIEEWDVARLLSHTLGEGESADHLLTQISKPLLQQARLEELGGEKAGRKTSKAGSTRQAS